MATDVAVLVARLEADIRDFDRDLKKASKRLGKLEKDTKQTGKATDKTTSAFGGMGKQLGVVFAGAAAFAAVKFFKGTIDASSNLNESLNAVNVVFGKSAEAVKKLGENAADSVGLANSEFNTLAVSFSAFVETIAGESGRKVVDVLEELTVRSADFASVMNIDVAEAATIFKSALAGETEPIRKFGIDVSAAAVNLKAMELGLADSTAELTEQDKVLARYELIMSQTEKTSGDFANTSDDMANAMRKLTAKFEDAKAKIGNALIPALEGLIPLVEDLVDFLAEAAIGFGVLTGSISPADAAIKRAKGSAEEGASGMDTLFRAVKNVDVGMINAEAGSDTFGVGLFRTREQANALSDEMVTVDGAFVDLIATFGITEEELDSLRKGGFEKLIEDMDLTEAQVQGIVEALELDLKRSTNIAKRHLKDDLEDALNDVEVQADDTAEAIDNVAEAMLALVSPAFAAVRAQNEYRTSIHEAAEAAAIFGKGSPEHIEALFNQAEAGLESAAANEILEGSLDGVTEGMAFLRSEEILTRGQTDLLNESILAFTNEPLWTPAQITNAIRMKDALEATNTALSGPVSSGAFTPVGVPIVVPPNISEFQHGGPFAANQPFIAGERGPELISPNTSGQVFTSVPTGGGSPTTINNIRLGTVIGSDRRLKEIAEIARRQ